MDIVDKSIKTVDNTLTGILSNPTYYGILAIFLAMYGPRLSPKLPSVVRDLFNNNYFRFAVILLVIYMSNNDLSLALILTIGFVLVMSLANSQEIEEKFTQNAKEGYSDFDSIREFYDNEEEFQNPPSGSPENNENFMTEEEERFTPEEEEGFTPEEEERFTPEEEERFTPEEEEHFTGMPEEEEHFTPEEEEHFTGMPEEEENFMPEEEEHFTPYEKHIYSVVNKYKFNQ